MGYLLDTNVLSELRKGVRFDSSVRNWIQPIPDQELFISVLVIAEIRGGIQKLRPRDPRQAHHLEIWLNKMWNFFGNRALPITAAIADRSGHLFSAQPLPQYDRLIAATALEHNLDIVTRNTRDFERTGVTIVNPWKS